MKVLLWSLMSSLYGICCSYKALSSGQLVKEGFADRVERWQETEEGGRQALSLTHNACLMHA